jgi:signal transduction histidine kinase
VVSGAVAPLLINHASRDPRFENHAGLQQYGIESYIAVPLVMRDGQYFGTLCALDPDPASLTEESLTIFQLLANLISFELEAEDLAQQREERLKESERTGILREQLMGMLGHDLRNPLGNIKMASQILLLNSELPPVEENLVKKIAKSVNRMDVMIGDLLDLTRTRLGQGIPVEPKPADLAAVCRDAVGEAELNHPLRRINLKIEGDSQAEVDAGRAAQVVSNLIGNAVQYSPVDTPIEIFVTGEKHEVVLAIKNQGKPIPPESLENIFDPFERAQQSKESAARNGNLGLGLYIVSQIMLAHKGSVAVTSSEQDETVFTVKWKRRISSE